MKLYMFGQFICPSSGVFHRTHCNGIYHTGLLAACKQADSKFVWHILLLCVWWKTPDDRQRNCPEHVEFHSKNRLEKLVHLVGFIIRNLIEICYCKNWSTATPHPVLFCQWGFDCIQLKILKYVGQENCWTLHILIQWTLIQLPQKLEGVATTSTVWMSNVENNF